MAEGFVDFAKLVSLHGEEGLKILKSITIYLEKGLAARTEKSNDTQKRAPIERKSKINGGKKGEEEAKRPRIKIKDFSAAGQLTLAFDRPIIVPEHFKGAANDTNNATLSETNRSSNSSANTNFTSNSTFNLSDHLNFTVFPGDEKFGAPEEMLGLAPRIVSFVKEAVTMDCVFNNPSSISKGYKPDILQVSFLNTSIFVDAETGLEPDSPADLLQVLPRQFTNKTHANILEGVASVVVGLLTWVVVIQILISLVLATSLKFLWDLWNTIQVIAYMRLLCSWPANSDLVLTYLDDAVFLRQFQTLAKQIGQDSFAAVSQTVSEMSLQASLDISDINVVYNLGAFGLAIAVL